MPQKIFTAKPNGEIDYVNPQWTEFTDLPFEEFRDGRWTQIIHPEDLAESIRLWQQSLNTGEPLEFVHRFRYKDGTYRWHLSRAQAMRDEQGQIVLWVGSNTDIHEQKRSEEELEKSQNNLRFLAEASKMLSSSLDYGTTLQNIADLIVPDLADYTRIALVEDDEPREIAIRHVDPEKVSLVKEVYAQYKDDGAPYGVGKLLSSGKPELIARVDTSQYQITRENRRLAILLKELGLRSYMGVPMKASGRVIGSIVFASTRPDRQYTNDDVALTEELASRASLAIENAKLFTASQQAIALRDQFLSIASHELRTPLTTVKAYAQLLQRKQGDAARIALQSNRLLVQVERLESLINELLDPSRICQGRLDFQPEPMDLTELSREVLMRFSGAVEKTDKHTVVLEASEPVFGHWDRFRLDQVLTNLLTNALKYSPEGGDVHLAVSREGDHAIVTVSDREWVSRWKSKSTCLSHSNVARMFVRWVDGWWARAGIVYRLGNRQTT